MPEHYGGRWVRVYNKVVKLADGVVDLQEVANYLARMRGVFNYGAINDSFRASFSRAVKSLLAAGRLVAPNLVPVVQTAPYLPLRQAAGLLDSSDGMHIFQPWRRTRFVTLAGIEKPQYEDDDATPDSSATKA
jgi:hypothetical protein